MLDKIVAAVGLVLEATTAVNTAVKGIQIRSGKVTLSDLFSAMRGDEYRFGVVLGLLNEMGLAKVDGDDVSLTPLGIGHATELLSHDQKPDNQDNQRFRWN